MKNPKNTNDCNVLPQARIASLASLVHVREKPLHSPILESFEQEEGGGNGFSILKGESGL